MEDIKFSYDTMKFSQGAWTRERVQDVSDPVISEELRSLV